MKLNPFLTRIGVWCLPQRGSDTLAKVALRELCTAYREPILRYIERAVRTDSTQCYGGRNAEDLTHDFLA